jgi:hypothetical protein
MPAGGSQPKFKLGHYPQGIFAGQDAVVDKRGTPASAILETDMLTRVRVIL